MESLDNSPKLYTPEELRISFLPSAYTICYMSICLTCIAWQIITAIELFWKSRKLLHFSVLAVTFLSFLPILCSLLNPLGNLNCDFRYWVSIIAVNISGAIVQSILLYKAYVCYNRAMWLLVVGSFINLGYITFTLLCATIARVPSYKDNAGTCVLNNLEWPALVKLAIDIASNGFLSIAFLMVIYRHYRTYGSTMHKSLLSSGMIFSIGVIASNIIVGILIASRVAGGLSADLYCFDWVLTGYLLIKQFKMDDNKEEDPDDVISQTMVSRNSVGDASHYPAYNNYLAEANYPKTAEHIDHSQSSIDTESQCRKD